jgi:ankyrin repeat protein
LAIDIIEAERSVGNIKKTIRSLPLELGSLYDIILRKVQKNDQDFITRVLHFISCALGPLETDALSFALAINGTQTTTLEVLDEQNIDLQASLILYTRNLLVFDNDSVSFSHQTFSQYLNDTGSSSLLPLDIGKSNKDIATACLQCLMLDDTMNGLEPSNVPFLAYSDRHWFEHVKRASDSDGKLGELLMSFVSSQRLWIWLQRRRATQFDMLLPESQNYPHILAALDLLNNRDTLNRLSEPGGIDAPDSLGRTPLHYALANNASTSIYFLVAQRSSKEIVDKNGWSCTHFAVYSGDLDLIRRFDTYGPVDPSILNLAIEQRHWAVADRLLRGIKLSVPRDSKDWRAWTGTGGRGIIHQAVLSRHKAIVDKLLDKNVDLRLTDDEGMNALHLAAKLAECSIAQAVISSAQLSIEEKDKNLNTALHLATEAGDIDVIRLLTEHHASLEQINKDGQLPLHIAAMYGYENIVDLLLAMGSPVNTDDEHASPLHMASAWGWHKVALKLIKAGADIESRDEKGRTPLYLAAYNGSRITVDLLLRYKANPNIADTDGRSPLHVAALGGWEPVVNLLLKRGVEVNTVSKQQRRTPLHYAACSKNPSDGLVKRLLDADANLVQTDSDGATAHDLAEKSNNTLIAELLWKAQQQHGRKFSAPSSFPSARKKIFYTLDGSFSATSMEIFEDVESRQQQEEKDVFSRLKGAGL